MAGLLDGVDLRTQMAGQNRLELLLFRLEGKQRFGINVFKVQEVIQCPNLTQIPGSHRVVRGIANMRGKTIPVMDLSMAIGGQSMTAGSGRFVIITEFNRRTQGFLVGSVDRIVNMKWEAIMPPPRGGGVHYMTAVTQVDDELVEIIDVEKVLKEILSIREVISEGILDGSLKAQDQHVLIVDDSSVARNQVKRVVEQIGCQFTLANNGQDALNKLLALAEQQPKGARVSDNLALVISDIEMPQLDGYSLTAAIKAEPRLADVHVVLHSSLSGVFNENMVRKVGADRFIAKYDPDELAGIVQERLKDHIMERAAVLEKRR
ncbi:MAG: chemotaxis protein [Pseudomonadota bacterium]